MSDKKIKVFSYALTAEFEEKVNEFINKPEIKVLNITYSTAPLDNNRYEMSYTAFVEYMEVDAR